MQALDYSARLFTYRGRNHKKWRTQKTEPYWRRAQLLRLECVVGVDIKQSLSDLIILTTKKPKRRGMTCLRNCWLPQLLVSLCSLAALFQSRLRQRPISLRMATTPSATMAPQCMPWQPQRKRKLGHCERRTRRV